MRTLDGRDPSPIGSVAARRRGSIAFALAVLAACGGGSGSSAPRCADAFGKLQSLGIFLEPRTDALAVGMACHDLTDADLACIMRSRSVAELPACSHAGNAILVESIEIEHADQARGQGDGADDLAAAVCACKDPACLVGLGEARRLELRKAARGPNATRLHACLAPPPPPVKKP